MHMIGHDAPGNQVVPFPIKMRERIGCYLCDARVLKPTRAVTGIQASLDLFGVQLRQSAPFSVRQFTTQLPSGFHDVIPFDDPLLEDIGR